MIKSICLPVDGSVYTDAQLKHAMSLAKPFGATIKVISIVDVRILEWAVVMGTDGFVPVIPSNVYKEESKKMLEDKAAAVLEKCAEILTNRKIDFTTEQALGSPADIILEQAPFVDLLVIGARGEFAKWKTNLVGATVDAVVRQWNKPILVTPQKHQRLRKLLFPYDGSEKSNRALQLAAFVASRLKLPIVVQTVHTKEGTRRRLLHEASTYLEPHKINYETVGMSGNPEKEIIQMTNDMKCNLIIMGAFGHSRIREAILGSTTEQVIRNTRVPILLSK